MKLLTIDTSRNLCAAMFKNSKQEYSSLEYIERGHAERLIPQIQQLQIQANWNFSELKAIVVNTGPGSFTGIRIGVAAARAFALALNITAIGISLFNVLAYIGKQIFANENILILLPAYAEYYSYIYIEQSYLFDPDIAQISSYDDILKKFLNIKIISTEQINEDLEDLYVPNDKAILTAFDAIARMNFKQLAKITPSPIYLQTYK